MNYKIVEENFQIKDDSYYWMLLNKLTKLPKNSSDEVAYLNGLYSVKLNAEQIKHIIEVHSRYSKLNKRY